MVTWLRAVIYLDISGSFGFWREFAVNCLQRKDWKGAKAGLFNLNSILEKDYLVKVNTREFQQAILNNTYWKCHICGEKTPQSQISVYELIVSTIEGVVSGQRTQSSWFCPKCKECNKEKDTHKMIEEVDQPSYRKVVPSPPVQKFGLQNRFIFESSFNDWFFNFIEELQHQLGRYRIEYVAQHGHDMMDSGYVDKGDED